jgi:hypothetical protein
MVSFVFRILSLIDNCIGECLLASAGQDNSIRLWRFSLCDDSFNSTIHLSSQLIHLCEDNGNFINRIFSLIPIV